MSTGHDNRSLDDLTTEMTQWGSAGDSLWTADQLRLNEATATKFLEQLTEAKKQLDSQLTGARGLQEWLGGADVGQFTSATTTRGHLQEDITSFIKAVTQYKQYLGALETTTSAAARLITAADQPR